AHAARQHSPTRRSSDLGAAAKGNTFLNVAGIGADTIDFVTDRNPQKQGCLLPGSHIPVVAPDRIAAARPDYLDVAARQQAALFRSEEHTSELQSRENLV